MPKILYSELLRYVIFNACQQRLEYLIEFVLDGEASSRSNALVTPLIRPSEPSPIIPVPRLPPHSEPTKTYVEFLTPFLPKSSRWRVEVRTIWKSEVMVWEKKGKTGKFFYVG